MDAREYLARKGLDGERDKERPNTLEEKAWSRARESGDHRPRSGTPHDWEDWERYHQTLAEGAEAIEQKIDHEAHQAEAPEQSAFLSGASEEASSAVGHFTPADAEPSQPTAAGRELPADAASDAARVQAESHAGTRAPAEATPSRPEPFAAIMLLAVLLPPLALALAGAAPRRILLSLVLMLLGWVPGAVYAVVWLRRR